MTDQPSSFRTYDPSGTCWAQGKKFEHVCRAAFEREGYKTRESTKEEDIKLHADFWVYSELWGSWVTVDAKARKRIQRNGPIQDEFTYIEWKNTAGRAGWLLCGADIMAFERQHDIVLITRVALLNVARELVDRTKKVTSPSDSLYASYSRQGREDEISMIRLTDIPKDTVKIWTK